MYKTATVTEISNVIFALGKGSISFLGFRVYLAALELKAIREAAKRSSAKKGRKSTFEACHLKIELKRLTRASDEEISRELRRLERVGLLKFEPQNITITKEPLEGSEELLTNLAGRRSERRPVPLPRRVIRFIAGCNQKSLALTMLGYCVRGLTIDRQTGELRGRGTVKASWIAEALGLSVRAVRGARGKLIEMGWITADEASTQWKLNRTGAYFEIDLDWKPETKENSKRVIHKEGSEGAIKNPIAERVPVENSLSLTGQFAPPQGKNLVYFAPPYKDKKTLLTEESKNQKTPVSQKPDGVFKKKESGEGKVSIRNVKPEDLHSFSKVEELYFQAVSVGLVRPSESQALNFLAAAIRARNAKNGKPDKILSGIIRRGLWNHITQAEEEQARKALARYRKENPERFRFSETRKAA